MMKLLCLSVVLFAILVFSEKWLALAEYTSDSISSETLDYAPGRILVKLKSIPKAMQEELRQNNSVSRTYIESIDRLNWKYGIHVIEPLFENLREPRSLSDKRTGSPLYDNNGLEHVFVFKTSSDVAGAWLQHSKVDVLKLAAEYSQNPLVEYAEPDYIGQGGGAVIPNDVRFPEQ